jgi:hypothetical protein
MTAAATTLLDRIDGPTRRSLLRQCRALAQSSGPDLAADFLAEQPTHGGRDTELLRRWAQRATDFGARLELEADPRHPLRVLERTDGIEQMRLAQFSSRPVPRGWFPAGSIRSAAEAHEQAHCHLHHPQARRELKRALDVSAGRIGPLRILAYIVGADELVAHSYAQHVAGLGRSPLLLSAALGLAADLIRSN